MKIDDMIKSGAVKEQKTGGGNNPAETGQGAALTAARPFNPEEQKCWDAYKEALQRGQPEPKAREAANKG